MNSRSFRWSSTGRTCRLTGVNTEEFEEGDIELVEGGGELLLGGKFVEFIMEHLRQIGGTGEVGLVQEDVGGGERLITGERWCVIGHR